ncbi:putative RNA recognition motif domain, nucleotide-binding alpha-beta plait domain superfamily [Helianthus debilis subsp. tardiflorus]
MARNLIKFFVSNLPEGCTPWELRCCVEKFGAVSGTYVAKKRDKGGCRFGFISFRDVGDKLELERQLQGIKMGINKLKVNVAKFAVENEGSGGHPKAAPVFPSSSGMGARGNVFNLRDSRSFRDVLGMESRSGDQSWGVRGGREGVRVGEEFSIEVPEKTSAFGKLVGKAVVGRTVDLKTLVDFDRLLAIAGTKFSRIQYLGGLSILISFPEEALADNFLNDRVLWGPWFSHLVAWGGQSFPLERVAWLRLIGVPMHLVGPEVLRQIGNSFGKVLHVPGDVEDEKDLSVFRVGILAGEAERIQGFMNIKWKNKSFRIRVEEEQRDWIPDCLGFSQGVSSLDPSPMKSSPVVGAWDNEKVAAEGSSSDSGLLGGEKPCSSGLDKGMQTGDVSKIFDFSMFGEGLCPKSDDVSNKGTFFFNAKKKSKRRRKKGDKGQPSGFMFNPDAGLGSSGKKRPSKRSRA